MKILCQIRNSGFISYAVTTALLFVCLPVYGAAWLKHFAVGVDFGGDDLLDVRFQYNNGDVQKVQAGELIAVQGGVVIPVREHFQTQLTLGIKWDELSAQEGSLTWYRFPFEWLAFYRGEKIRFGGGLTHHLGATAKLSLQPAAPSSTPAGTYRFEDETGYVGQFDYFFTRHWSVGFRYSRIDYSLGFERYKAPGMGIIFGGYF